jgi:ABC-2 type transport system permease protein
MGRSLIGLMRKEFIQVLRDPNMVRLIFMMPVIQLILFGYVVNTEVKLIGTEVYDFDRSQESREFVRSLEAGDYFIPQRAERSILELQAAFKTEDADMALVIPPGFSEELIENRPVEVGLIVDGTNANSANIGIGYASQIAREFSQQRLDLELPLKAGYRFYYNPEMESQYFMVPAIVAALLTMITVMLTSMAIVREREQGTLEQIMVTPIGGTTLMLGKILPFAILGLIEMVIALTLGVVWFQIPFVGSPLLLFGLSLLYLMTTLGLGLFFSTVTSTQQQAMFFAWFFSVFALLTSGFFTPIENMPTAVQYVTYINPMRYFVEIVRGIILKGSGPVDLWGEIYPLMIFGVAIFTFATMRFTKRTS